MKYKISIFILIFFAMISTGCDINEQLSPFDVQSGSISLEDAYMQQTNDSDTDGTRSYITGKITDPATGLGIVGALVTAEETYSDNVYFATTDDDGTYSISVYIDYSSDNYYVKASKEGYQETYYNNESYIKVEEGQTVSMINIDLMKSMSLNLIGTYNSPDTYPRDLACDGTNVFIASGSTDIIDIYSTNGSPSGQLDPGLDFYYAGITYYNGSLWVSSYSYTSLYMVNMSTDSNYTAFTRESFRCQGMTYYDGYMWLTDYNYDRLYKVSTSGSTVYSISCPDQPRGITEKDGFFYIIKGDTDKIVKIKPDGTVVAEVSTPGSDCYGITFDGTYFWVSDSAADKIYKLEIVE